jgi:hypothetical protein
MKLRAMGLGFVLSACTGGGGGDGGDAARCTSGPAAVDGGPLDASCGTSSPRLFVTTTSDYASGSLCAVDTTSLQATPSLVPTAGDAVLGFHGTGLVLSNYNPATQDNVSFVDRCASTLAIGCQLPLHRDCETGAADPRGYLALDTRRGYVARLFQPTLAIVDPVACAQVGDIDLSGLRGSASLPNPYAIARVGGEVWVTLQRLPPGLSAPTANGAIAIIDPTRDALVDVDPATPGVQAIELPNPEPQFRMAVRATDVLVACVGLYADATDGAVVSVDIATRHVTTLVREIDVGANIDMVIALDADRILLRLVYPGPGGGTDVSRSALVAWQVSTRTATQWLTFPAYTLTDPVLVAGRVFVGDRGDRTMGRPAGIRVLDATTGREITTAPIDCGLPPYDLVVEP